MSDDHGPKQKQALLRIDEQSRIRVRKSRRVGDNKRRAPFARPLTAPGSLDNHIVRGSLARTVKPAHKQVPVWQLDNRRRVVMPLLRGEDQLALVERLRDSDRREQKRNEKAHTSISYIVDKQWPDSTWKWVTDQRDWFGCRQRSK